MLLIKGITPEIYFGNAELEQAPLSDYLTVHGDWLGRVNVNTAREEVIAAIIAGHTGNMDMGMAQQIYDEARHTPFDQVGRLRQFIPPPPAAQRPRGRIRRPEQGGPPVRQPDARREQQLQHAQSLERMFRVNSYGFRIHGDGMMGDAMVRVEAYVLRHPYDMREVEERLSRLGTEFQQEFYQIPRQMFRILDWKVVL